MFKVNNKDTRTTSMTSNNQRKEPMNLSFNVVDDVAFIEFSKI